MIELSKRQSQIAEQLQAEEFLNVDSLADRYQVTTQT
ncbi:MAG: DeoR family transcriptional regulator, partial [Gammaproteobacteria bacterium]|nr:DeoR family transcriptional regulator [Gammaproteobacteria bacterium]MCP3851788.1 DeoR family transcriptional regulator [Gammaproteobacteria bacterium]